MSFWNLSDNTTANTDVKAEFEIGGGSFDVIPDGSSVLALIDKAVWTRKDKQDFNSPEYLELTWAIQKPEALANRRVFHKLWVSDFDPNAKDQEKAKTKKDKALRMLAAIDANASGKLATLNQKPTDDQLGIALINRPMVITLGVWEDQNKNPAGNWVRAVAPKTKALEIKAAKPAQGGATSGWDIPHRVGNSDLGDDSDIPF